MTIQVNTDKNIKGDEKQTSFFVSQIENELQRFEAHITRIEVHLSDDNASKEGANDKRCLLEARLEGLQPIAVTAHGDTVPQALSAALDKMNASLTTIVDRRCSIERP